MDNQEITSLEEGHYNHARSSLPEAAEAQPKVGQRSGGGDGGIFPWPQKHAAQGWRKDAFSYWMIGKSGLIFPLVLANYFAVNVWDKMHKNNLPESYPFKAESLDDKRFTVNISGC